MCHRKTSSRSIDASEGEAANFHAYDRFGLIALLSPLWLSI